MSLDTFPYGILRNRQAQETAQETAQEPARSDLLLPPKHRREQNRSQKYWLGFVVDYSGYV